MSRTYSVAELDALRRVMENKYLYGSYRGGSGFSRNFQASDKAKIVEEMVRTAMLAGHSADDYLVRER